MLCGGVAACRWYCVCTVHCVECALYGVCTVRCAECNRVMCVVCAVLSVTVWCV